MDASAKTSNHDRNGILITIIIPYLSAHHSVFWSYKHDGWIFEPSQTILNAYLLTASSSRCQPPTSMMNHGSTHYRLATTNNPLCPQLHLLAEPIATIFLASHICSTLSLITTNQYQPWSYWCFMIHRHEDIGEWTHIFPSLNHNTIVSKHGPACYHHHQTIAATESHHILLVNHSWPRLAIINQTFLPSLVINHNFSHHLLPFTTI